MTKTEVFQVMRDIGKLEYGATITGDDFRRLFMIETVVTGTKKEFDNMALEELACAGLVRDKLLNEGKYFKSERDGYRVLLPSENMEQVLSYMQSADNKLKRGLKLNKNTPHGSKLNDNDTARMVMKQESIKRRVK